MAGKSVVVVVAGEDKSGAVLDAVNKHLEEVRRHAEEADSSMSRFGETATRALERLGIYFGAREIVRGIGEIIKQSVDLGMEIGHLSKQTGISTENLSVLKHAADVTGVGFETLTKGFKKFSEELFEYEHGGREAKQVFDELGVSQKDLNKSGGDVYKMLGLIADKIKDMPDGWQKNAVATQLFGRAGQELIPVLNEGSEGIEGLRSEAEDLGLVLDQKTIRQMEEMHKQAIDMQGALQGLSLEITSDLAPAFEYLAKSMTQSSQAFSLSKSGWLKEAMGNALSDLDFLRGPLPTVAKQLQDEGRAQIDAARSARDGRLSSDSAAQAQRSHAPTFDNSEGVAKMRAALERYQTAKRQLQEEYDRLDMERAKANSEAKLAELDSAHKRGLISDAQYYAQKLAIQNEAFQAESSAIHRQMDAITAQQDQVRARKAKDGAEAKKNQTDALELERQHVALEGQLATLDGQRLKANTEIAEQAAEALQKSKEQSAELAAQLEKLRGGGSDAQVNASRVKYQDQRTRLSSQYGADSSEVRELDAIQKLEEAKIRLASLDDKISAIQAEEKMQELKLEDQLLNRQISQIDYARDLQALRQQEVDQLKALQGEYGAAADAAGKAGEESKTKLEESITGIEQSMQKLKSSFATELEPILEQLEEHPRKWQENFARAADMIEKDMLRIANARLLDALGLGDNSVGKNGNPAGKGVQGLGGLGGWFGKIIGMDKWGSQKTSNGGKQGGAGTIADATATTLQQGQGASGSGVVVNLITQGTPQQVSSTGSSGSGKLEQMIVSIILKDADTLGPMTQALSGAGQMIGSGMSGA